MSGSGGRDQRIRAAAPIDTIPLFVRAGSIVPMGSMVESTHDKQTIARVRVYPGADARFTLFNDDGKTYAYETGAGSVTQLKWNEAEHKFTHDGAAAWTGEDSAIVEVVGK